MTLKKNMKNLHKHQKYHLNEQPFLINFSEGLTLVVRIEFTFSLIFIDFSSEKNIETTSLQYLPKCTSFASMKPLSFMILHLL